MSAPAAAIADELFAAFEEGVAIAPLTPRYPELDIAGAYAVQRALRTRHEAAGRSVSGRKIGLTSRAVQRQFGVHQPDFGFVLDSHTWPSGATLDRARQRMIAPMLEGELAFVLAHPLRGPGITPEHVVAATEAIVPVFELIDSRVADWKIGLIDTICDNASCFGAVLGTPVKPPTTALAAVGLVLERDGQTLDTATGAAVLGHPARAVAWLADALAAAGDDLPAGQPILSGAFSSAFEALPGRYRARFGDGIGEVEVRIT